MARGTLRIYLGAAPGVGKTYAMLNEGWRGRERGKDVVVGLVELHGRERTAEQLRDLEVIPRRTVVYRGQEQTEMDLEAVLARRPKVALVDELAHTNVAGSRNEKRWGDVEELLAAGIDVVSTLNIQHLESLNDVVERIAGVTQRETIPDAVVRAADQIELVDMTPEALRRRLAHGNVYAPEQVDAALANYFRVGNLSALRELALLWIADRVDEALQDYRRRHDIAAPWETKERVVVALTGAPAGETLIRRGARMAARTKAELIGIHVRAADGMTQRHPEDLVRQRDLLRELGGTYRELTAGDVARALVQTALAENATQLIVGASHRSRLTELVRGSVINTVVREAGGAIDVHVISTAGQDRSHQRLLPHWPRLARLSRRRQLAGLAAAVAGLPLLTLLLASVRSQLGFPATLLLYLFAVMGVALLGGLWPALVGAIGGFLLLNYYFTPPFHTFTIASTRDVSALVAFVLIAGLASVMIDLISRRDFEARRARAEARSLAAMAGSVLQRGNPLPELVDTLVATFGLEGAAVLHNPMKKGEPWTCEATAGAYPPKSTDDASMVLDLSPTALLTVRGLIAPEDREVLGAFASQLSVALESRRLQDELAEKSAQSKANELRTALLTAVSHDLRTPLASIKAAATSMLADDVDIDPASRRELLETIDGEADRLNTLVGNLLGMSRLQAGALPIVEREVGIEEVVAMAVAGMDCGDHLEVDVSESLPRVLTDPTLVERAVANLVENALTHSGPQAPVRVEAATIDGRIDLRVIDRGVGISAEERGRIFLPFQRLGDRPHGAGIGLGLAVARGFVEAVGGELTIEDTPGGGTTMVVSLPIGES
jgi:two-component system, OmpR family, sensor histidine kinase KdpD